MKKIIVVAGATGNLGKRIVKALIEQNTEVHVIVRSDANKKSVEELMATGAKVFSVKSWKAEELIPACQGASCIVSALAGLREVIIDAQKVLLDAAVKAGVPRFIPSDYSLDFTNFNHGENRNLDLRREFHTYLDNAPIKATTIFNGAFMDMITGQMPLINFKKKLVLYWGKADYRWDFTTVDNTATYTAFAALDDAAPRVLHVAGNRISPKEIREVLNEITGEKHKLFRAGGKSLLSFLIKVARTMAPGEKELYPAWQGMQYMRNMIDERSEVKKYDNDRYPGMKWTSVKDLLKAHLQTS